MYQILWTRVCVRDSWEAAIVITPSLLSFHTHQGCLLSSLPPEVLVFWGSHWSHRPCWKAKQVAAWVMQPRCVCVRVCLFAHLQTKPSLHESLGGKKETLSSTLAVHALIIQTAPFSHGHALAPKEKKKQNKNNKITLCLQLASKGHLLIIQEETETMSSLMCIIVKKLLCLCLQASSCALQQHHKPHDLMFVRQAGNDFKSDERDGRYDDLKAWHDALQ